MPEVYGIGITVIIVGFYTDSEYLISMVRYLMPKCRSTIEGTGRLSNGQVEMIKYIYVSTSRYIRKLNKIFMYELLLVANEVSLSLSIFPAL